MRHKFALSLAICVALAVWSASNSRFVQEEFTIFEENRAYASHPSAELAYEIGERHFNSILYPQNYDIDRAEYFFDRAVALDPHLQYIWHELARIAFLRSDFPLALSCIDVQIAQEGDKTTNSYYVRALIEGFMGNYASAEADYSHYLRYDPIDWAAVNDYSWVLLKDNKPAQAHAAITAVIQYFPNNPWLLNSDAIALWTLGATSSARSRFEAADKAVSSISESEWSRAYPGNDPSVAEIGLSAFKDAVEKNMHKMENGAMIQ